jgi:hypothetical protein
MFFHPAAWMIGKFLLVERELACDDWAVKVTGEPRRYASCLTRLVEELRGSKPLAIATGIFFGKHIISRRVEMILDNNRNSSTFIAKPAMVYALGMAIVCVGICSLLSPVIAVPAGQNPMVAQISQTAPQSPIAPKTDSPKPAAQPAPVVESQTIVAATPMALVNGQATATIVGSDDREEPLFRDPQALFTPQTAQSVQFVTDAQWTPVALANTVESSQYSVTQPTLAYVANQGYYDSLGQQRATTTNSPNSPPAISESELLTVLSDVVKRDADPAVRTEALQGIVRMRSDASITTLISLYDNVTDVKVKGEIIPYLLRRKGDNAKATAKLVAISKSEKDDELRRSALSQIVRMGGDEAIASLIDIYDSLQDPKVKMRLISSLSSSKNRKAVDKLIQIAKSDSDPAVRQAAIRALSNVDNRVFMELTGHEGPLAPPVAQRGERPVDGGYGIGTPRPSTNRTSSASGASGSGFSSSSSSSSSTQAPPPAKKTTRDW